jgi:hypothetical protein
MTDKNPSRLWAIVTALAGVASLAIVLAFQNLPEVKAAAGCTKPGAVLLYEFARSQADLDAVFGPAGSDCRPKVIAAMDAVNTIDVWFFIPAYTLFVSAAALFLSGGALRPLAWVAIALAIVAAGADYVETLNLLAYTPDLAPPPERLVESSSSAWVKFFCLGLNALALAGLCFTATPRRRWILGALLCLPIAGVTLMAIDLNWMQAQSLAFFASWTPLMVMAARAALIGR